MNILSPIDQEYRACVRWQCHLVWCAMRTTHEVRRVFPMVEVREDSMLPGWWPFTPKRGLIRKRYRMAMALIAQDSDVLANRPRYYRPPPGESYEASDSKIDWGRGQATG